MLKRLLVIILIFSIVVLIIYTIFYLTTTNHDIKFSLPFTKNTPAPTVNKTPTKSPNLNDLYGLKLSDFLNLPPDRITLLATGSGIISSLPDVPGLGSIIVGRFQRFTNHTIVVKKNESEISVIMPNGFILYVKDDSDHIKIIKVSDDNPNSQQQKDYYMNMESNNLTIVGNIRQNMNGSFEGKRIVIFIQKL